MSGRNMLLIEKPAEPAGMFVAIGRRGLPDLRRPEVRMVRLRITDVLDDRNLSRIIQGLERPHCGIETNMPVDIKHLGGGDRYCGSQRIVSLISVWDKAIQSVVSTLQIDQDKDAVLRARQPGKRCGGKRAC